jgi:integrase
MTKAVPTWTKTNVENVYRHTSGTYYARVTVGGNKTWRSLRTQSLGVARTEVNKLLDDLARLQETGIDPAKARTMTGTELLAAYERGLSNKPNIKDTTLHYWKQVIKALGKSWPEFLTAEVRKITEEGCQAWAGRNKDNMSASRFNSTLGLLKSLFAFAVRKGARRTNPAAAIKRRRNRSKNLSECLPNNQQFRDLITAIRNGGGRFSKACADFVELLAYTGLRTGEAKWLRWSHCHFDKGELVVVGDPKNDTKNGDFRHVPMIPAARELLERMHKDHPPRAKTDKVLLVFEAQKAMDRAFTTLGMPRLTHHDMRHLFATRCIESGIDIPTVSRWLGHKDGGALAMKVYGHLRNEHSLAAAGKVSFAV